MTRQLRWAGAAAVLLAWHASTGIEAQPAIRAQSLGVSDNLYLLSGSGGNALMMTADVGTVLVDTGAAASAAQLAEIASTISDQPITTIIYTHAHADHTGGGSGLPAVPRIVAHPQTRSAMRHQGVPEAQLPATTVTESLTLFEGPDRVEVHHVGVGHTAGDLIVVFPGKRLAYLGDLFPGKVLPVVDRALGGSYAELPETLDRAIARLKGVARIIPGHAEPPPGSPIGRWITFADLQEYAAFTRDLVDAVRSGLQSGASVAALAARLPLPARYASYDLAGAPAVVQAIAEEIASASTPPPAAAR